jgi:hypothetical protein
MPGSPATATRDVELRAVRQAADPAAWLAVHLSARYDEHEEEAPDPALVRLVGLEEILADDAALLRQVHRGLTADGTPPAAAATYLADWYAGAVGSAVAYCLAVGGAGFEVDAGELRWHLHPDGWPLRVELGRPVAVLVDGAHPWAGRPEVTVLRGAGPVIERAVTSVVAAVTPIIDACHGLAKVGRAGLWNEVADGIGMALAYQLHLAVTDGMLVVLDAAVRATGVPWKATPSLRWSDSNLGRLHVAQKGGCCLAYTRDEVDATDDAEVDAERAEYLARFPRLAGEPRYCSTCSFRDAADCDARQVYWLERTARTRASSE